MTTADTRTTTEANFERLLKRLELTEGYSFFEHAHDNARFSFETCPNAVYASVYKVDEGEESRIPYVNAHETRDEALELLEECGGAPEWVVNLVTGQIAGVRVTIALAAIEGNLTDD